MNNQELIIGFAEESHANDLVGRDWDWLCVNFFPLYKSDYDGQPGWLHCDENGKAAIYNG